MTAPRLPPEQNRLPGAQGSSRPQVPAPEGTEPTPLRQPEAGAVGVSGEGLLQAYLTSLARFIALTSVPFVFLPSQV